MHRIFKTLLLLLIPTVSWASSMNIDGSLDEPQWNSAFEIKDFYETSPFTLKKNELQTTALIFSNKDGIYVGFKNCLLYTSPSPRDRQKSRMPSSA